MILALMVIVILLVSALVALADEAFRRLAFPPSRGRRTGRERRGATRSRPTPTTAAWDSFADLRWRP